MVEIFCIIFAMVDDEKNLFGICICMVGDVNFFICMIFAGYERNYECDNVYMYEIMFWYILSLQIFPIYLYIYTYFFLFIIIFIFKFIFIFILIYIISLNMIYRNIYIFKNYIVSIFISSRSIYILFHQYLYIV